MEYELIIKPSAQKDLNKLPLKELERVTLRLRLLKNNPRPVGVQKLSDEEGYRIRSGKYRILFTIDDINHEVFIYRLKH